MCIRDSFAPGASEPRDGSTLWSETARRLAGQGVVSLRADRDGAGDRALLWSDRDPNPYRYLNAQALREQAQWLADHFHTDVVATVLCSGAWAALRAAREPAGIAATSMVLVSPVSYTHLDVYKRQVFFVQAVEAIRAAGHRVAPLWIGGGDADVEQLLREHGVEVTGWVGHHEVREHLQRCLLYTSRCV